MPWNRREKQLQGEIETHNNRVFGEFTEHSHIKRIVAILIMNPQGEFGVRYMEIQDICILEGHKSERG